MDLIPIWDLVCLPIIIINFGIFMKSYDLRLLGVGALYGGKRGVANIPGLFYISCMAQEIPAADGTGMSRLLCTLVICLQFLSQAHVGCVFSSFLCVNM